MYENVVPQLLGVLYGKGIGNNVGMCVSEKEDLIGLVGLVQKEAHEN